MSNYLSATELAELIACGPTSYACMRRWLDKHTWAYQPNRRGFPQVLRAYYDARMNGQVSAQVASAARARPNFAALARTA